MTFTPDQGTELTLHLARHDIELLCVLSKLLDTLQERQAKQ